MSRKALALALVARCLELRQAPLEVGLDSGQAMTDSAAEGRPFDELLASGRVDEADLEWLYQDFLAAYDPRRRHALGVYYTPGAVVQAQVRLVASLLEQRLGCQAAFDDERVAIVDPAAGSGAYPLAVAADVARRGTASSRLAGRLTLVEPMAGAARIASERLARRLGGASWVQVHQQDVLAAPLNLSAPILVCLGNPPYNRQWLTHGSSATRKGGWVRFGAHGQTRPILADFLPHATAAARHAKNLYNDYVYFWRWAVWAVLEQRSGPGIVSFVTAASFLRGPGFSGMRAWLRRSFDDLWVIDLEGDRLAARRTHNVFPIRTPVAITMGVRYAGPRPQVPAEVRYTRLDGTSTDKLAALEAVHQLTDLPWRTAEATWSGPMVARVPTEYHAWPMLTDLFPRQLCGAQFKRTWPIGPTPDVLRERWQRLLELSAGEERALAFKQTRDRTLDSTPSHLADPGRRLPALRRLAAGEPCIEPVRYAYRSFDRQWVLPDTRLADFIRPALWQIDGPRQIFLTSLLTNVPGPGPAVVATALVPDLDHFRGSFGGRAVLPLWCDARAASPNIADGWLEALSREYGFAITPERWLAYCYALLGNRGYAARFEEQLRTPGARVPVTADAAIMRRVVDLGERLLRLHTYGQGCLPADEPTAGLARCVRPVGPDYPHDFAYDDERQMLLVGPGRFRPVGRAAWAYAVSGMRVIAAWLGRRITPRRGASQLDGVMPRAWSEGLTRELLELLWLVEGTLALEPALDAALDDVVSGGTCQLEAGGVLDEKGLDGCRAKWPGHVVALPLVAAELLEPLPL